MTIRIDRITVNRGGPLGSDFEIEPGDLNLIYGQNESGKTYVVEAMITFLFKTRGRGVADWGLRGWELAGSAVVSGLENHPVSFDKTDTKLEEYWENEIGLPRDFSRLLVVRAGETVLARDEEDSVGRDILKDYLSGEGLLDKIADRISPTVRDATIQNQVIDGARRGELKARREYHEHVRRLQSLLEDVEESYASGEVSSLRQQQESMEAELEKLERARRYHAAQLNTEIQNLSGKMHKLPSEAELATLESGIKQYDSTTVALETKSEKLKKLEGTSDDYTWTKEAFEVYQEITGGPGGSGPKPVLVFLSLVLLAGAVIAGLLKLGIPLVLLAAGSAAVFILHHVKTKEALAKAGDSTELERLKAEFHARFGTELTDKAAIRVKLEELKENHILATPLKKEVEELTVKTRTLKKNITETLKTWSGVKQSKQTWRGAIGELKAKIRDLDEKIHSLDKKLKSAGVREEEYLDQDPGEEWNADRHARLTEDFNNTEKALSDEEGKLERLKTQVSQETHSTSSDWEELIDKLRDKHEETAQEYRQLTAEILAGIQVTAVIQDFRKKENERIAEGLKRAELTKPLHALTGRYKSIRLEDDRGLVLVSDKDEDYPLSSISTGAREQIFLALRMGFASIAMEGNPAFLILDDAFQHSDWDRRKSLVAHTLGFVRSGWQVFYFSMDDHIRDLFLKAGKALGDKFKSVKL